MGRKKAKDVEKADTRPSTIAPNVIGVFMRTDERGNREYGKYIRVGDEIVITNE